MGKVKKAVGWIITSVIPVVEFVLIFWPPNAIWTWVVAKGAWFFFVSLFLSFGVGFALSFLVFPRIGNINSDMDFEMILKKSENHNNNQKRYSIVVVDDMFKNQSTLNKYRDNLSNYDICFLPAVLDINMLSGFDIIILDIMGTGYKMGDRGSHGDVNAYMLELFKAYPYKYIIAASTDRERLKRQEIVGNSYETINKVVVLDQNQKKIDDAVFIESIRNAISHAFDYLDHPSVFWQVMCEKAPHKTTQETIKDRYIHYLFLTGRVS